MALPSAPSESPRQQQQAPGTASLYCPANTMADVLRWLSITPPSPSPPPESLPAPHQIPLTAPPAPPKPSKPSVHQEPRRIGGSNPRPNGGRGPNHFRGNARVPPPNPQPGFIYVPYGNPSNNVFFPFPPPNQYQYQYQYPYPYPYEIYEAYHFGIWDPPAWAAPGQQLWAHAGPSHAVLPPPMSSAPPLFYPPAPPLYPVQQVGQVGRFPPYCHAPLPQFHSAGPSPAPPRWPLASYPVRPTPACSPSPSPPPPPPPPPPPAAGNLSQALSFGNLSQALSFTRYPTLEEQIYKQIEFYFSDVNLVTDKYLKAQMDHEGWVPISTIARFNMVALLTQDVQVVERSLLLSKFLEVRNGNVRRRSNWWSFLPSSQEPRAQ